MIHCKCVGVKLIMSLETQLEILEALEIAVILLILTEIIYSSLPVAHLFIC